MTAPELVYRTPRSVYERPIDATLSALERERKRLVHRGEENERRAMQGAELCVPARVQRPPFALTTGTAGAIPSG